MASWKRLLLVAALASVSATAAIAILVLLFGDFGNTEARILGTTLAISLYSLLSLPGAILLERRVAEPLGWLTVALAALAFVLAEVAIGQPTTPNGRGSSRPPRRRSRPPRRRSRR